MSQGRGAFLFSPQKGEVLGDRARAVIISERFLFVLSKRNPSDSKEKNAFGAVVRQGIVFTTRFDIDTLVSLNLYETGVLSFSRDGALRRSAHRVIC